MTDKQKELIENLLETRNLDIEDFGYADLDEISVSEASEIITEIIGE